MSSLSRLALALVAASSVAACNNLLAKNNPCGGIYPADGVAEIFGVQWGGTMAVGNVMQSFDSSVVAESVDDCETFSSGSAADDGTGTTKMTVSCHDVEMTFAVPDVRSLAESATLSIPATVGEGGLGNTVPCRSAQATMTVVRATGAKAGSPQFVTSDFLRSVTLEVTSDDGADASSDGGRCPSHVVVHARADFAAKDYKQATTSGENHCPSLPSK